MDDRDDWDRLNPPDDGCSAPGTDDLAGCRGILSAFVMAVVTILAAGAIVALWVWGGTR